MPNINDMQQGMRKAFKTPQQEENIMQKIMNYFTPSAEVPAPAPTAQAPQLNQQFLQGVQQGFSNLTPEEQAKRQALLSLQRGGF